MPYFKWRHVTIYHGDTEKGRRRSNRVIRESTAKYANQILWLLIRVLIREIRG